MANGQNLKLLPLPVITSISSWNRASPRMEKQFIFSQQNRRKVKNLNPDGLIRISGLPIRRVMEHGVKYIIPILPSTSLTLSFIHH